MHRKFPGFEIVLSCKSDNSRPNLWDCKIIKVELASKAPQNACVHYPTGFKTV
jgi:hypothetical protein